MKKSILYSISILVVLVGMIFAVQDGYALDAPHDESSKLRPISCSSCHYTATTTPDWATKLTSTEDTYFNNLCTSCHISGSTKVSVKYSLPKTHSATVTGSAKHGGNWTVECRVCHMAHSQEQTTANAADQYISLVTGTVSSLSTSASATVSSITDNSKNFSLDEYAGYLLIPNNAYPTRMFRIKGNTANKITVYGALSTAIGKTYSIRYGKMVKGTIKYNSPSASVAAPVKFLRNSGESSFATGTNPSTSVCMVCHTQTKYFTNEGILDYNAGLGATHPVAPGEDCIQCHSHTEGFKIGGCNNCHGQSGSTGAPLVSGDSVTPATGHNAVGAHPKHVVEKGITACSTCHNNNGMPTTDNKITVAFSGNGSGGTYQGTALNAPYSYNAGVTIGASQTCSTVYCHSSGQSANGQSATPSSYASPVWTNPASGACGTCHQTTAIATGSHAQHLAVVGSGVNGCGDCHTGAANDASSYTSSNHANKLIDVKNSYSAAGAPGNGYGTCSAATCHGAGSYAWGTDFTGKASCTKCHGKPTLNSAYTVTAAAPGAGGTGRDTAGNTTGSKVGAHRSHLEPQASYNYALPIDCSECHTVPVAFTSAGHANGTAEVPIAGSLAATNDREVAGTPTYSASQCSNVYCHDSSRFKHGWPAGANSNPTPTWNNTTYLGADKAVNCGRCHGNPPGGEHPVVSPNACAACHPSVNPAGDGFVDVSKHANGLVEGGGCDGCHGNPPVGSNYGAGGMVGTGLGTGDTGATDPASPGAHNTHVNADPAQGRNIKCDACHMGTAMPTAENKIDMGFQIDSATFPGFTSNATVTTGVFYGYNGLTSPYQWNASNLGTTVTPTSNRNNNCSSVYCHGGGATGKVGPLTGGTNTMPSWVGTNQAVCGTCHGGTDFNTGAVNPPTTGAHVKHTGATNLNLPCNLCHNANMDMTHVNGSVSWALNTSDLRVGSLATYNSASTGSTGQLAPSASFSSCSSVYCHSNAQSSPPGGAVSYNTPTWSGTIPCGTCHDAKPDAGAVTGSEVSSGSHFKHVSASTYNIACSTCHSSAGYGNVKHVDHSIDVNLNLASYPAGSGVPLASYGGTTTPGDAYGSCATVYCHSTVQAAGGGKLTGAAGEYKTPTWGNNGSINCGSCHTDMSTTDDLTVGTHKRHTNTPGVAQFACSTCHGAAYTAATVSYATHANGVINTNFTGTAAGTTYLPSGANVAGNGYGTCSTSNCHGRGTMNWGTYTEKPTCEKCHSSLLSTQATGSFYDTSNSDGSPSAGAHKSHLLGIHNIADPVACNQCHIVPTTVGDAGHNDTYVPAELTFGSLATHVSVLGTTFSVNPMVPNYDPVTRTCSSTYCHAGVRETNEARADLGPQGSKPTPTWNDTGYLGGTGCDKCHSYPPSYPHPTDPSYAYSCSACHDHVDPTNYAFGNKSKHVNGQVEISVDICTDCHSYTADKPLIGAHAVHTDPDYFLATSLSATYSGAASGGSQTTLTDGSRSWPVNYFAGNYMLLMTSGANVNRQLKIVSNTNTSLTVIGTGFAASIANGDTYSIRAAKKLSSGDYEDQSWHYTIHYKNGFPTYACGFCHPLTNPSFRNDGIVQLDLDPTHSLNGTVKTKNSFPGPYSNGTPTGEWFSRVSGSSVVCSGIYCHSNGFVSEATNSYAYKVTPDWYSIESDATGSVTVDPWNSVDRCAQCHGNSPNTGGTEGSSAHVKHAVGIHYEDTFSGTTGKLSSSGSTSANAHGNATVSTTISCNICHSKTVEVSYNDKNATCNACHTGASSKGTLVVAPTNTAHVNGTVDVSFGSYSLKTKAQLRDTITNVSELNASWSRTNGYKASNSYDASKRTPSYTGGTCSTVDCHNGTPMQWSTQGPLSCNACHRGLPQ